jgi:hypothetical protein
MLNRCEPNITPNDNMHESDIIVQKLTVNERVQGHRTAVYLQPSVQLIKDDVCNRFWHNT